MDYDCMTRAELISELKAWEKKVEKEVRNRVLIKNKELDSIIEELKEATIEKLILYFYATPYFLEGEKTLGYYFLKGFLLLRTKEDRLIKEAVSMAKKLEDFLKQNKKKENKK